MSRLPVPRAVSIEPVVDAPWPAEWAKPPQAKADRAVLHLHGGGYFLGSCRTARPLAAHMALATKCPVLTLDYRLAPEHPFPAAVEDATAAARWLMAQGLSPERLALAGDSAGGGLAVATALALRDEGERLPGAILCFSPWTDLALSGESLSSPVKPDPLVKSEELTRGVAAYCAGQDACHPLVSPIYADLQGLPPVLIQVGDAEVLLSDSLRLADAATEAGTPVTLEVWKGMWHVWQTGGGLVPEGRRALNHAASFLDDHLAA